MRKRLVTILAHLVSLLVVGGCEGDPVVFNVIPEFDYVYSTLHETGIGATLYCGVYIPDDTHIDEYEYGFILNDNNDLSSSSAFKVRATLSDNLSLLTADVSNLAPDKNYYYAAYVSLGRQELRSQTYYFRTGQTQQSINISFKNDVLYSVNEGLNTKTVQEAGFCWSKVQDVPTIFDNVIKVDLKSDGSFSAAVPKDWKQNVQYFVRAYIGTTDNCIQYSEAIPVKKQGDDPAEDEKYIEVENDLYEIGSEGSILSIQVSRNVEIQVSSDVDWIEHLSTKAVSTDSLSFLVFRNDTGEEREGHLLLEATDGSVAKTITVIQSGYEEDMNIRFADNVFKSYMVEHFDIDQDGGISEEEAALVEEIETVTDDISSLGGLEYCTNLKKLVCHGSQPGLGRLSSLNISKNIALEYLDCSNNNITSLSVNENQCLKELVCSNNKLNGLYVNKAKALEVIDCGNNALEYVDITNLSNLKTLICSKNRLKMLNTEQNTALSYLDCSSNSLKSLNFHYNNKIEYLNCSSNNLMELDLSENSSLTALYCNNNSIKEILVCKNSDKWEDSNFVKDDEAIFIDMYQPVSIPDPYFKEYLVQKFDSDADGEISRNEALSVTSIDVCTDKITSIQGIEFFVNLESLTCKQLYNLISDDLWYNGVLVGHSKLSKIDLSANIHLEYLRCDGNSITELIIPSNIPIREIDCSLNNIVLLEVNNPTLESLVCSMNQIANLDICNCLKLSNLMCYDNQLSSLDISSNTALKYLHCYGNILSTLDVSKNVALTNLVCSSNQLTSLDVSNNLYLTDLSCANNHIPTLDISKNSFLTELWCSMNNLSSLDVSKNTYLHRLSCSSNQLTSLDVSKNTALTELWCSDNNIPSLDVSKNTSLHRLSCSSNQLTSLDVSKNTSLTELRCNNNNLSSLDVSNNISLSELDCSNNQLTALDVSNITSLKYLWCGSNPYLSELWMANNQQIENLSYDSSITTIKYK